MTNQSAMGMGMQFNKDDEDSLREILIDYRALKKAGKILMGITLGILGFIVLLHQAWTAIRSFFSTKTGLP